MAEIAAALDRPEPDVRASLRRLAEGRVLIPAPGGDRIWAANPFCAEPTEFRVESAGIEYRAICIWDALGIPAALGRDAIVRAPCGDCGEPLGLEVREGRLEAAGGIVHFAVPARRWWDNIGFT